MYHSITIVGNLGKNPEMRYTPSGQAVTNFSVASTREYSRSDGERVKETTWFRVSTWGKQAEACNQYLGKGSKVLVVGTLNPDEHGGPRIWGDPPRASFEVTASTVRFLSSRQDSGMEQEHDGQEVPPADDMPF